MKLLQKDVSTPKKKRDYRVAKAVATTSVVWFVIGILLVAGFQYGQYKEAAGRLQGLQDAKSVCTPVK